jgi:hypothetical protein
MNYQFRKHYTRDQARTLLPQVREWLETLESLRRKTLEFDKRLDALMQPGCDVGGPTVNGWIRALAQMRDVLVQFQNREIQIKDVERGLVDFPAIIGDKEVFLCWEKDEDDIEFWHDIDSGYAGRERL